MESQAEYLDGQDLCYLLYKQLNTYAIVGFNIRIGGGQYFELRDRHNRADLYPYFNKADELIKDGKIFYVHPFKCKSENCNGRFQYGGGWACNDCGTCINTPEWWKIKVEQDGDQFCCIGNGFINLQESENYAFGGTKEEAIQNYRKLFI